MAEKKGPRAAAENRRARHDYLIEDTVEAGMMLLGSEVKSLRAGHASLAESYAGPKDGAIWLLNCHIPPYEQAGRENHEAKRARRATTQAFGSGEDWSALPCIEVDEPELRLIDLVVHDSVGGFKSKRDARERIKSGAVKIDSEPATDPAELITPERCGDDGLRLQIGRKKRFRVKLG